MGFPGPGRQTGPGAGGAGARWTGAHGPARPLQFRVGSKEPALIYFLTKRCMFGQPFGRPDRPPAHGPAPPAHAFRPRHLYSPPPSTPVRPSIESLLSPAQPRPSAGPGLVARAAKSLRDIVLTGSPAKRSLVPSHAFYISALSCREYRPHHRALFPKWLVNGLNTSCHSPVM